MKLLLTLVTVYALLNTLKADEAKESRYIDENALKAILELTRQPTPVNAAFALKPQYPYLSQKEKLTQQGERQTHYPLQSLNGEYGLLPQSLLTPPSRPTTQTKDPLVDVKPIYIPYPLKNHHALTSQAALQALAGYQVTAEPAQPEPKPSYVTSYPIHKPMVEPAKPSAFFAMFHTLQHKQPATSSNLYLEHKQPVYHAYPQQTRPYYQGYSTAANSPSFLIINPTNCPSHHYYTATNYSFPRGVTAIADESWEPIEPEEEQPDDVKDLRLETVHSGQSSAKESPLEVAPLLTTLPNGLNNDERVLAQALLQQTRQPENFNAFLEVLKREQLKRRMQERVAAFYFRNLQAKRK